MGAYTATHKEKIRKNLREIEHTVDEYLGTQIAEQRRLYKMDWRPGYHHNHKKLKFFDEELDQWDREKKSR